MIDGANSHVDGPNFSELSSGLQTGSTTVQTSSAPLTIEVRQSNEDNAVKAVPTKNEPTSVPRIPSIVPPQSNKVTVGGVDQAARKKLNRTIDLLNYPDTVEILASEDAGCVRFIWIFILLGLVLLSAVQITYLVYQFINEETGTSIRYEKIEPDFVKNNFQMKICFKDPPIDVFESAVMTKFPDSVKRNETQKLIITLAVLNQMGIASFGETIAAFEEQFKNRVGREPSHVDYKQQAEEFKTILKSSSTNMREIVDDVTVRLIDQYIHIDGESLLMQGLGGVGRELCIRRPTTDFTLKPSYLVVHEQFPIRNGKLPLLNDSKFTFYGGQLEEYLSAAHFVPMSKSMAYYNVEMIRYVYQNRKNAPCKSSDDFLFPKGFAQSVCEKECWNRAHAETFNCSKINTNRTPFGLTDEHGAKEPCGFPTVLGYTATEIEAVWNNYIKAYEKCLDKAKCETEQYCTEYEITSKLIDPTPVKQYTANQKRV